MDEAEGARTEGAWFLSIRVAGGVLRVRSRHRTMNIGREYAAAVLAATTGPTHTELLAAVEHIDAGLNLDEPGIEVEGPPAAPPIVVIACGAAKVDHATRAAELYTSGHFTLMLKAARRLAEAQGGRVVVLSALHGLVELDRVLDPYDLKMGEPGSIIVAALAGQLEAIAPSVVTTLLPHAYAVALDEAAELAGLGDLIDLFAEAPGIGYQRGVASRVLKAA
ncbi:MAG: DUF6884 domain-containing protein [Mycobacterium sp.]